MGGWDVSCSVSARPIVWTCLRDVCNSLAALSLCPPQLLYPAQCVCVCVHVCVWVSECVCEREWEKERESLRVYNIICMYWRVYEWRKFAFLHVYIMLCVWTSLESRIRLTHAYHATHEHSWMFNFAPLVETAAVPLESNPTPHSKYSIHGAGCVVRHTYNNYYIHAIISFSWYPTREKLPTCTCTCII